MFVYLSKIIRMKQQILFSLILFITSLSIQAQNIIYHGAKHHNIKVEQLKKEGTLLKDAIIMLGDSHSEYGADWNRFFPNAKRIINRGVIGDDSQGIAKRLYQILPYKPHKIFFECGTNELSHGWSVEQTFKGIINIIETIRKSCPNTKLYVQTLLPLNKEVGIWKLLQNKDDMIISLNKKIENYCYKNKITFIDLYHPLLGVNTKEMRRDYCRDGLHLTHKGYECWADIIRPYIYE